MEGRSHTIIKVQLYQSIGESKKIIKIGLHAAPIFTHFFLTHLFILHLLYQFLGPETQAATYFPLPVPHIKIDHDAAAIFTSGVFAHYTHFFPTRLSILHLFVQFWGPAPQGATHFLLPVPAGPAPQGATYFLLPVSAGARGAKPLDPNSNFTSVGFCPLQYTFLNLGVFAHFWCQGAKYMDPNSNFTPGAFAHFEGPISGSFCQLQYTFLNLGLLPIFGAYGKGLSQ
jgi:hypothetical protein